MSIQKAKSKRILGVTQPSHESVQKALLFLLETSAPRLAEKRTKEHEKQGQ